MDAILLSDGLKGFARCLNRVAEMRLGSQSEFRVEVEGEPQAGSLELVLRFLNPLAENLRQLGKSELLVGIGLILSISGFTLKDAGKTLIAFYKKLRGRAITNETDLKGLFPSDFPMDPAEFVKIYNDPEVQTALRAALRPVRQKGIESFETRVNRKPVESVAKADVEAADAAEMEAIVSDEEKVLDVEKASFVPHLAWHLSDHGKPFDAKIEDPVLWRHVELGDRFGYGDKLHVTLHTEAERESNGRLQITRTVTKVHRIERSTGVQKNLFPDADQ
jgi:hypothetical protein